jgi:hypothetical protein
VVLVCVAAAVVELALVVEAKAESDITETALYHGGSVAVGIGYEHLTLGRVVRCSVGCSPYFHRCDDRRLSMDEGTKADPRAKTARKMSAVPTRLES